MTTVPIGKIVPDENQPRKYFAADKMFSLKESIKKHGIRSPLTVEDLGSGKYLLTDGERRFRAAQELKLTEVPVVIEKAQKGIDRLIIQFNIQEQHESWTPIEKANAIIKIADEMGMSLQQAMKLLSISEHTARRYAAFAALVDKENFTRNEIPIDYALVMNSVKSVAITKTQGELEEKFTRQQEKQLENRITDLISSGDIRKKGDVIKIKDSFSRNPKMIEKFLSSKMGTVELYKESKAKGAYHLRNMMNNAQYVNSHGRNYLKLLDIKLTPAQVLTLEECQKLIKKVLETV
jgi:ParB/RepB/Spo0J family partition protein